MTIMNLQKVDIAIQQLSSCPSILVFLYYSKIYFGVSQIPIPKKNTKKLSSYQLFFFSAFLFNSTFKKHLKNIAINFYKKQNTQ